MASCDNADKLISIVHSGVGTMAQPVGGSIDEEVTWSDNRTGNDVAPTCTKMDTYNCNAEARWQGLATPGAKGTNATLTYTVEEFDLGNGTIAVANMLNGAIGFDFNSRPFSQKCNFKYGGSSTQPITVSM